MCNGCNHGFECCAHDGMTCGCELEDTPACMEDALCDLVGFHMQGTGHEAQDCEVELDCEPGLVVRE